MTTRTVIKLVMPAMLLMCAVSRPAADVVHESQTQTKLSGTLGTISKIFGLGKPVETIDYYVGDKMRSDVVDKKGKATTSKIIDLDKGLFITLDHKHQTYTQLTLAQWRQALQTTAAKVEEAKAEQNQGLKQSGDSAEPAIEWSVSFNMSRPKGTENINGRQAQELIMTVDAKGKPKSTADTPAEDTATADMRMTSTSWYCSSLDGTDEIDAFDKKLVEELGFSYDDAQSRDMWQKIMQNYPEVKDISDTLTEKTKGLEGTPIRTHVAYEIIGPEKAADQQDQEQTPASLGGLMKGFGKKVLKKDKDTGPKPFIEITSDLVRQEVTPVDPSIFAIPANYKLGD